MPRAIIPARTRGHRPLQPNPALKPKQALSQRPRLPQWRAGAKATSAIEWGTWKANALGLGAVEGIGAPGNVTPGRDYAARSGGILGGKFAWFFASMPTCGADGVDFEEQAHFGTPRR